MWNNLIGEQIRRSNRNLMVCNLVLALLVVGWLTLSFRSLYNQFAGPQSIEARTLVHITEPQKLSRYYFKIDKVRVTPVLYQDLLIQYDRHTNREKSREVQAVYQLMRLPGGLLAVKSSSALADPSPSLVSGALVPLPAKVKDTLLDIAKEAPDNNLAAVLLPTMLDTERFQGGGGSWALAFMVPPLFLAVWNIKKSMARRDDFLEHPICKQLKKHGDPRELAGMIEHEVRDSTTAVQIGGLTITKNWLISRYPLGLEVRRLDELVWAHRHELTTSVYFVPVSKSQSMYIYFNDRSKFMVSPSMKDCDRILQVLAERAPWAIYGFSAEKSRTWNKTPDVVIAQVEKNKSKLKEEAKGKGKSDAAGTEKGTGGPFA